MNRRRLSRGVAVLLAVVVIVGCSTAPKQSAGDVPYEAKILIGQRKGEVLTAVEKVFGRPKQTGMIFPQSDYEVELRRYWFTNVSDFVMYFHRDTFIQAGLMPVDSPEYPALRSDYQRITPEKPGPVLGYTVFMSREEVVLDTIQP